MTLIIGSVAAFADNVDVNTVDLGAGTQGISITQGGSANVPVRIIGTGGDGGPSGTDGNCNATSTNPAIVDLTGRPAGVTIASGNTFTGCSSSHQNIVIDASSLVATGDYTITTSTSNDPPNKSYAEDSFVLRVVASIPADTTAP